MKSFLITLLIIGSAFLVYDYWLTPPWQRLVFERAAPPAVPVTPVAVEEADVPVIPPPAPVPKSDYVPRIPEIATTEFVPPVMPSLEDLTAGWTKIPAQAFPRQVTLKVPVDVKMAVGAARLPAGSTAYAYGENGGRLTVGPTSESPARGSVALTETDLPDQLRTSYAQWKTARIEQARRAWQARKTAKPINDVRLPAPVNLAGAVDSSGRPQQSKDGTYPLLLASMRAGDVTDITVSKIRRWGQPERIAGGGGKDWAVDVWYMTIAFCGPVEAHAQARVSGGRVTSWVYPGSGEPVP